MAGKPAPGSRGRSNVEWTSEDEVPIGFRSWEDDKGRKRPGWLSRKYNENWEMTAWWCTLCHKWLDPEHEDSGKHKKKLEWWLSEKRERRHRKTDHHEEDNETLNPSSSDDDDDGDDDVRQSDHADGAPTSTTAV